MGVIGRSRGRGGTQHIASSSADDTATSCVAGLPGAGAVAADPELPFFGSRMTKRMIFPVNAIIHNIYIHIC